jgi:uncharacterized membrane protein HdeD (DUF308 family)
MKIMKSSILRAIASIIVGGLLLAYPEKVTVWLVIVVGCLFLIPGVYSIVTYWTMRKQDDLHIGLPIAGVGSTLLGIWMILDSTFFLKAFMMAIAILLIVVAVNRIVNNIRARKYAHVPLIFYVFPVLLIIVSGYVLTRPLEIASIPFYILGVTMIVYGLIELWNSLWLHGKIKKYQEENEGTQLENLDIVDAEIVEETTDEVTVNE